jgi:putative endonuclease
MKQAGRWWYSRKILSKQQYKNAWRRGYWAEWWACFFLLCKGYWPVKYRYKAPTGEVDLIMKRGKTLVMVEVKLRATHQKALHSITYAQQKRIWRSGINFAARYPHYSVRFDYVLVNHWFGLRHLKNRIQANDLMGDGLG